jgi:hypothetical protein
MSSNHQEGRRDVSTYAIFAMLLILLLLLGVHIIISLLTNVSAHKFGFLYQENEAAGR